MRSGVKRCVDIAHAYAVTCEKIIIPEFVGNVERARLCSGEEGMLAFTSKYRMHYWVANRWSQSPLS